MGITAAHGRPPDFLCVGAQKSGTTWLYKNLVAHPSIWLPPEKELHYFDEATRERQGFLDLAGRRAVASRWALQLGNQLRRRPRRRSADEIRWCLRYFLGSRGDDWYCSLFRDADGRLTGEMTPAYSTLDDAQIAQVHRLAPDARILLFVRHPVERAWSQAGMDVLRPGQRVEGSEARLRDHFRRRSSLLRSDYLRTLRLWSQWFDAERIFVGFLEDAHLHPRELLGAVCAFLAIDEPPTWPRIGGRVHVRSGATIPAPLAADLARIYADSLEALGARFGGYADWWRFSGRRLAEGNASADIPYPLYRSVLWEEWLDGNRPVFQSGVLAGMSDVGTASSR